MTRRTRFQSSWTAPLSGSWRRAFTFASLLVTATLMYACGGVEGQGTGSAASYSEGPISGFGSIIVNGIHFNESGAHITDDEGRALRADQLKLGMTVRIDGGQIDQNQGTAVANAVRVGSDLVGRVSANDVAAGTLSLLGQSVRVTASTVFDETMTGGQAGLALGSTIEVFAILDPVSGVYAAQRVQPSSAPTFKLRGVVANLDTSQRTFRMGGASLTYDAGAAPQGLADGQWQRLTLHTSQDGNGRWVVSQFADGASQPNDGDQTEIESVIDSFTSNADFMLSGVRVNAASARIEPAGTTLAAGLRVEVEGTMRDGVLMAEKVQLNGSGDDGGDDDGRVVELDGPIDALDKLAKTFVVHGQLVAYADAEFDSGDDESELALHRQIEVRGHMSIDGTFVIAERIKIED